MTPTVLFTAITAGLPRYERGEECSGPLMDYVCLVVKWEGKVCM